ncbi:MAG: hypothetical protein CMP48_24870 [Rickettsiales bacterium]|nr:hypothetical protein [Rickettsiales bacterium]
MDQLGYKSFINYHDRRESESFTYKLSYSVTNDKLEFSFFDTKLQTTKSISTVNNPGGNNKNIEKVFEYLFNQKVRIANDDYPREGASSIEVIKYDSAQYFIEVKGEDEQKVLMNYLKVARYLTGKFKTIHDNQPTTNSVKSLMPVTGTNVMTPYSYAVPSWKTYGFIVGSSLENGLSYTTFQQKPDSYKSFKELYIQQYNLPELSAHPEKSTIYIFQTVATNMANTRTHIFINGNWDAILGLNEYILKDIRPGKYELAIQVSGKKVRPYTEITPLSLGIGQAKAYVVAVGDEGRLKLVEISSFQARRKLAEMDRCIECVY